MRHRGGGLKVGAILEARRSPVRRRRGGLKVVAVECATVEVVCPRGGGLKELLASAFASSKVHHREVA